MKRIYSVCTAVLAIFSMASVSAQEFRLGFSWGIKSGANLSSLITESKILQENDNIASRWGYTGGCFVNYRFSQRFMLSFDVLFSGKGFKADLIPGITDAQFRLNYLDLPILANFYIYKGLALKVGLQPSILLNANVKGKLIQTQPVHSRIRSYDCAVPLGISYDFTDRLILDIRYTMGGYGVLKNLDINNLNNNSVLSVTIGYRL